MRKKRILTKLTKLLTGFVFFGLTCIFGETSLRAEELSIGITRGNNISVLIKEGEVYYTNRTYLNTRNYNEKEEIVQDGKYILTVEAEDAAGNMSEKTIEFIVDRTLPRIIVSGLREDGTVGKGEKVILRLFDEQDRFVQVLLNGAEQVIDEENQQVILPMEAYGDYKITVKAIDPAENELTQIIDMSCALAVNPFEGYKVIEKTIRQEEEGMKNTWKSKELKPGRIILAAGIIVSILMVTVYIKFVHSQSLKCACNKQQRRTH